MNYPKYTNIDALQRWFFDSEKPYWTLYAGHGSTKSAPTIATNVKHESVEDAWQSLEQTISDQGQPNARFTVYVSHAKKGETGHNTGFKARYEVPKSAPQIAGAPAQIGQAQIAKQISDAVTMAELRWENRDLQDQLKQQNAPVSIAGQALEFLREDPQGIATLFHAIGSMLKGNPSLPGVINGPPVDKGEPFGKLVISEQAANKLAQLQEIGLDVNVTIIKACDFIIADPDQAKKFLGIQ